MALNVTRVANSNRSTLSASRIVAAFQPHRYTRTRACFLDLGSRG